MPNVLLSDFQYDVFISYNSLDQEWIDCELMPRLEKAQISYIDQSQFGLGHPKLNEIERAIGESHHTLLVITPNYLKSTWQQFDSILVGSYGLDIGEWRAIPAIVQACELPMRLQVLVSVDLRANEATKWKRLICTLSSQPNTEVQESTVSDRALRLLAQLFRDNMSCSASFKYLVEQLNISPDVLQSHLDYLERQGYIVLKRRFLGAQIIRSYSITPEGKTRIK